MCPVLVCKCAEGKPEKQEDKAVTAADTPMAPATEAATAPEESAPSEAPLAEVSSAAEDPSATEDAAAAAGPSPDNKPPGNALVV